jgi:hypothetical protein
MREKERSGPGIAMVALFGRARGGSGESEVAATGVAVLFHVALGGIPVAGDQIQDYQAASGQLALLAARRFPNFFVQLSRAAGRGADPEIARRPAWRPRRPFAPRAAGNRALRRVAFAFHLPGVKSGAQAHHEDSYEGPIDVRTVFAPVALRITLERLSYIIHGSTTICYGSISVGRRVWSFAAMNTNCSFA